MAGAPEKQRGEDRITAIPRDPQSVFVYWELNGPRSAEVVRELGPECQWILRVLNISDGTSRSIPVARESANYYLDLTAGETYGFELGVRSQGKWRTVCRTERVQMPQGIPSPPSPEGAPLQGQGRPPSAVLDKLRTAARGLGVPGLSYESTALHMGSSPRGPWRRAQ